MKKSDYKNSEAYKKGIEYFLSKYEPEHIAIINKLYEFSPQLANIVIAHGLYDIWTQMTTALTDREKEIAVLSSLITSCTVHSEIKAHAQCLLNVGMSKEEIKEILVLLTLYIGVPKVILASNLIDEAFKEYDEARK
jgi:4-carboxymuconolactone decarboxylase